MLLLNLVTIELEKQDKTTLIYFICAALLYNEQEVYKSRFKPTTYRALYS